MVSLVMGVLLAMSRGLGAYSDDSAVAGEDGDAPASRRLSLVLDEGRGPLEAFREKPTDSGLTGSCQDMGGRGLSGDERRGKGGGDVSEGDDGHGFSSMLMGRGGAGICAGDEQLRRLLP